MQILRCPAIQEFACIDASHDFPSQPFPFYSLSPLSPFLSTPSLSTSPLTPSVHISHFTYFVKYEIFTFIFYIFTNLTYFQILKHLDYFSVDGGLLRADVNKCWQIFHSKYKICPEDIFALAWSGIIRGNRCKIVHERCSLECRRSSDSCIYLEYLTRQCNCCSWNSGKF